MFKRKNSLPPRPLPPTKLQLIEDLQATDGHDILFEKFLKSDYSLNKNDPTKENERQMISNMKDFIQLYRSLREKKDQLTKCNEELLKNDSELKQLAKDIEKQAINALHMN